MKVVIFGLGGKYRYEREFNNTFFNELEIVAYTDNNEDLWGKYIDGKLIIQPKEITFMVYDYVIVMSNYYETIARQLVSLEVPKEKIIHWDEFLAESCRGKIIKKAQFMSTSSKSVLLLTTHMEMNGGTLALLFAARALKELEYNVTICAPSCRDSLADSIIREGIGLIIVPAIQYPKKTEIIFLKNYDYVLVNVFQMYRAACLISKIKPIIWWIHENSEEFSDVYPRVRSLNYQWNLEEYNNITVCPVTNKAAEVFHNYYPRIKTKSLLLGIPDFYNERLKKREKLVCAIIGTIEPRKNQGIAIEVLKKINIPFELFIIGKSNSSKYYQEIIHKADDCSNIKIIDELSRNQIESLFGEIDIVLCTSLEETLSMTIIEGLMNKKICITSDATGIADYITDGVDGFIFKSGDVDNLKNKLTFVIENWEALDGVREAARKTYEENFTLDKLGKRITGIFEEIYSDK